LGNCFARSKDKEIGSNCQEAGAILYREEFNTVKNFQLPIFLCNLYGLITLELSWDQNDSIR
jgi:hypothetical protein